MDVPGPYGLRGSFLVPVSRSLDSSDWPVQRVHVVSQQALRIRVGPLDPVGLRWVRSVSLDSVDILWAPLDAFGCPGLPT